VSSGDSPYGEVLLGTHSFSVDETDLPGMKFSDGDGFSALPNDHGVGVLDIFNQFFQRLTLGAD
ncbi:MAG TPA: hypothetical protein VI932_03195, partial [Bacteroidota bacterium]|nr:hypothetical protein [Bacteroidota bacterium]